MPAALNPFAAVTPPSTCISHQQATKFSLKPNQSPLTDTRAWKPCYFASHLLPRTVGKEDRRCGDEPLGGRNGADDDPARSCPGVHPEGAGLKRGAGVEVQEGRGRHRCCWRRLVVARGGRRVGAWREAGRRPIGRGAEAGRRVCVQLAAAAACAPGGGSRRVFGPKHAPGP
jgi:hypothetical protein